MNTERPIREFYDLLPEPERSEANAARDRAEARDPKEHPKEVDRLRARVAELEAGIAKAVKKANGNGMGQWPEFKLLAKLINRWHWQR